MTGQQSAWLLLLFLGLFFVIIGIQGNLGVTIAILFSPDKVLIGDSSTSSGGF